jgi:hypothetical protein
LGENIIVSHEDGPEARHVILDPELLKSQLFARGTIKGELNWLAHHIEKSTSNAYQRSAPNVQSRCHLEMNEFAVETSPEFANK